MALACPRTRFHPSIGASCMTEPPVQPSRLSSRAPCQIEPPVQPSPLREQGGPADSARSSRQYRHSDDPRRTTRLPSWAQKKVGNRKDSRGPVVQSITKTGCKRSAKNQSSFPPAFANSSADISVISALARMASIVLCSRICCTIFPTLFD